MKKCNICEQEKELTGFYKEKSMPDGYRKTCKECKNKTTAKWRLDKREEWNAYMRKYNKQHSGSESFKKRDRNKALKNRYGITLIQYEQMLAEQNGCCFMCKKSPSKTRPLVVDHNHDTGKIRALLCDGCNVSIAILDNKELLEKALAYKAKHS